MSKSLIVFPAERFITNPNGGTYGKEDNAWMDYQKAVVEQLQQYDHPFTRTTGSEPHQSK